MIQCLILVHIFDPRNEKNQLYEKDHVDIGSKGH